MTERVDFKVGMSILYKEREPSIAATLREESFLCVSGIFDLSTDRLARARRPV